MSNTYFLIISILFTLAISVANGYIALQLGDMEYKKSKYNEGKCFKGNWHTAMGFTRLFYAITLLLVDWKLAVTYVAVDFTFYDAIIDAVRGKSFWYFKGQCEHWGSGFDWDCVMNKAQSIIKIPVALVKIILLLAILYFLWS